MAKRSRGKHAAPAAKGRSARKAQEAPVADAPSDALKGEAAPERDAAPEAGAKAASEDDAAEPEGPLGIDPSPEDEAADGRLADRPEDKGAPAPFGPHPPKKVSGAPSHAAPGSGASIMEGVPNRGARLRTAAIAIGSVIGFFAIIYFAGVFFFSGHYMPNTTVAGIDFSLQTPEEMSATLDETLDNYSFSVVGKGMNFTVTSADASLSSDSAQVASDVLASEDAWKWPIEIFQSRDLTGVFTHAISANGLADIVNEELAVLNATAKLPVNATIAFDEEAGEYVAVDEVKGTAIDADALLETIISGLMRFDDRVVLTDEELVQPTIFVDDPRIGKAVQQANEYVRADFDLLMGDNAVMEVNPAITATWVSVSPELEVAFDDVALSDWATEVSNSCNTVGSQRSYMRPDGKEVIVSGGTYGWKVDNSALVEQVVGAVKTGSTEDIVIPVLQSGTDFSHLGGQDWGSRYVDVDLSEQYARFYDGDAIIWESPIVSGNPNKGNSTPQGVWSLNSKQSPATLIGQMTNEGTPEYETHVQYWMPFKGNSVGLHDATWQPYFGGTRYLSGGSHGCVNLPYNAAKGLYEIIQKGDVVVVHK